MKLPKILVGVLVSLLVIVVFGILIMVYLSVFKPKPKVPVLPQLDLFFVLKPAKNVLKTGEKISVPVYITGESASKISAYDFKVNYDPSKLKLVAATPGEFFNKYLTVKWDLQKAWFAMAMTPSPNNPKEASVNSPLIILDFVALEKTASTDVSTAASIVYVSKTGGFTPQSGSVNLSIK